MTYVNKNKILLILIVTSIIILLFLFFINYRDNAKLNLIVICIDTLRADHLSCYGYNRKISPNIDKLARSGIKFNQAYSQAPWTLPSISSILTSLYPSVHGAYGVYRKLSPNVITLAEILKENGFSTSGVVSHIFLDPKYGLNQGFDDYYAVSKRSKETVTSDKVTELALKWLSKNHKNRFFLFLHYFDPHYDYIEHDEFKYISDYNGRIKSGMDIWEIRKMLNELTGNDIEYLKALYDGEIAYTDKFIGILLDSLKKYEITDKTVIVLVADHGEQFMDHGWIGHTKALYNELINVPLIIKVPNFGGNKIVSTPVELVDIVPTVLKLLNVKYDSAKFQGDSLMPLIEGRIKDYRKNRIFSDVRFEDHEDRKYDTEFAFKRSVISESKKFIYDYKNGSSELYDLKDDPKEKRNIINIKPEDGTHLKTLIEKIVKENTHFSEKGNFSQVLTEDEKEKLKSLGYIK